MDIQIRDVKPFEQYCIDEFSMCHDDGDFERDVLGFYESIETERLWRVWELQAAKAQAVPEGFVLIKYDTKTVVAIERMVEQQVEASGMDSRRLERLDGWKIIDAAVKAQQPSSTSDCTDEP